MNMIVYTCVIGETDPLRCPTTYDPRIQYLCFSDNAELLFRLSRSTYGWRGIKLPKAVDPCLKSREIKILAHRHFPGAAYSLWLDAAYRLDSSPTRLLSLLNGSDFVAMRHPHRNRISDEAEAIIKLNLAPEDKVRLQLSAYREKGFDTDEHPQQAITSTGFLLRKHNPKVALFENLWWEQVRTHTYRDQMSIDFVISQCGVKVRYIPGHYRDNPYAKWHCDPKARATIRKHLAKQATRPPHPNVRPAPSVFAVREMGWASNAAARPLDCVGRGDEAGSLQPGANPPAPSGCSGRGIELPE